jgi:TolB-like protein/Flp pilus assembly protein TadD
MKCPKCQFENPDDTVYCGKCASPLQPPKKDEFTQAETFEAPKEELTTGITFAGRYQIIEEIGKGGMGKVYKVLDKEINTNVALKLIKPEIAADEKTIERFRNELKTARDITHKNVCRMYDLNKEEGSYYITMEYVPGEDLRKLTRKVGQLSAGKSISIVKQICEGLSEAHRLGVVHRDLKPQNIMVDEEGNARIMDFGIARSLKAKGITDKGIIIGTPEYMSPEQVEGKGIDHRSDIYSLGIILYEMVAGRVPFEGDTPLSIAMKHKNEMPKEPIEFNAQIPEDLNQLILKCLEKDKNNRFQNSNELLSELIKIEKEIPTTEKIVPKRKPTTSKEITVTFRKRWLFITALFVAVIIAGISILYFIKKEPAIPPEPEEERKMLAVLPFENLGSPEDEYFSDGITDEIMSRLAIIHEIGLIARSSTIKYKRTEKPIEQISEELGVNYILEGTVRWQREKKEPSRIRVTPKLIRISDSTQIWSEPYDAILDDIFQVQSDIAQKTIKALDIALSDPSKQALESKPTDNLDAYQAYLRGKDYAQRFAYSKNDLQLAIQMFERAVELEANFALAYTELSVVHSALFHFGFDRTPERLEKAKAAVDRALELQPELPEAHLALGSHYYWGYRDYDRALKELAFAEKSLPNDTRILFWVGAIRKRQGRFEEAIDYNQKAFKLSPQDPNFPNEIAICYAALRRYEEADEYWDRTISVAPDQLVGYLRKYRNYRLWQGDLKKGRAILEAMPKRSNDISILNWFFQEFYERNYKAALDRLASTSIEYFEEQETFYTKAQLVAQAYQLMSQPESAHASYDSARILLEAMIKELPDDNRLHSSLGIVYAGLDRKEDAIREGKLGVELGPDPMDILLRSVRVEALAVTLVMAGEYDAALEQIEYLLSTPSGNLFSAYQLRIDPRWDPLRDHPRYQELLEKYQ